MDLNLSKFRWLISTSETEYSNNLKLLEEAGLEYSPAFLRILAQRGVNSIEAVQTLTNQHPDLYHDPFLLFDMEKARDRIQAAIMAGEAILIYGDYDADGITSTLILYEALDTLGANVSYYLPNRFIDGYGPNKQKYQEFINQGIELIITCDNGVAGHEAVDYANSQKVDVIITDHHEIKVNLPQAYAVIHPRHPEGTYPFGELSGAGVALKLASVLLEEIPPEAVELAMIGTIADLVSLTDENRTIVMSGLSVMKQTQRIGLQALLDRNDVKSSEITEETIGFIVGPRLNAVGRLGTPDPGFQLLASLGDDDIIELVDMIEKQNQERKEITQEISKEIINRLDEVSKLPDIIIEASQDWHPGVLGIVAGNISGKYHRPTILFTYLEKEETYKGSGRSIEGFDLFHLVNGQENLLSSFGGHAQAIGLTLEKKNWETFRNRINEAIKEFSGLFSEKPLMKVDSFISVSEANITLAKEIELLRPFGTDNLAPVIGLENLRIKQKKLIGKDQQTLKINISDHEESDLSIQAIGFKMGSRISDLNIDGTNAVIGRLSINRWNNQELAQLQMIDFGSKGSVWQDYRGSTIAQEILNIQNALYLFQNKKILDHYATIIPETSKAALYKDDLSIIKDKYSELVIFELPTSFFTIESLLTNNKWQRINLAAFSQESKVMVGLPSRQEASLLYRWLIEQPPFEIRSQLEPMSQYLKLPVSKIILLIMMFFDAGFVIIKDGWLQFKQQIGNEKVDIFNTPAYLKYTEAMKIEELLVYQPIDKVKEFFEGN